MNRLFRGALLFGILLLPLPAQATGIVTGDQIKITGSAGTLGGGAFSVDGPGAADFLTFCIEINEFIQYDTPYFVKISTAAESGGAGGQVPPPPAGTSDPLDSRTAYLYSQFLQETLGNYAFNGTVEQKKVSANALQLAIWRIEGELDDDYTVLGSSTQVFGNASLATRNLATSFFNDANTNKNGSLYGIRVMQVWQNYNPTTKVFSGNKQDQLISVPDATSTLAALLLGAAFLGLVRMRYVG
jgi:hypothetical protein